MGASSSWQRESLTFTVPTSAGSSVNVQLKLPGDVSGSVYADIAHDCKIFLCTFFTPEASRNLGFYFYHSQITFRLIVIKGYTEIL